MTVGPIAVLYPISEVIMIDVKVSRKFLFIEHWN